ncbi:MAG: helix-turn-helix domain-containing protein [Actinophytocola sp.]|uniref:helix-turn-helix domain-containing protein n=1 Tax=Actinophytocola sp. TaxID=1872138 RepID=UPI003D6A24DC
MGQQTSPTFRRRKLARRLRQMREAAGLTLDEAAPKLDKTKSALSRLETAMSRADVHIVRSMMDLYDHYDPDLIELARESRRPGWWKRFNIESRGFIDMETEASTELELSLVHVPGLLQTEDYMRALFTSDLRADRGTMRDNDVAARIHRQQRLSDEEFPLELVAIIDEATLRKSVGGSEVMRGQLRHLIQQAELPTVTLQVLPNDAGAHLGMDGPFIVLSFPEDDPDLLFISYITGSLHIEKPEEVEAARLAFDRLRSEALSPRDSVAFIDRVRGEI